MPQETGGGNPPILPGDGGSLRFIDVTVALSPVYNIYNKRLRTCPGR
jgi:hypothetical protein